MGKRKRGGPVVANNHEDKVALKPQSSKLAFNSYEDIADSEDEFHINKDKIHLNGDIASRSGKYGAIDDEMQLSDEEVLGYSSDDQDEMDDEEAPYGEQGDTGVYENASGSEDDNEDELSGWGPSKADYYDADTIQTEQDALDEEAEARRIQQKRLKALTTADFGFDENEWLGSGKNDFDDQDADEAGGVVTEILPQLHITEDMGPAERLKLLKTRYPEFEPLSKELVELQPLHTEMVSQSATHSDKVSKLKLNALSGYLGSLAMYFAILTSPASTGHDNNLPLSPKELREHEIMDALVQSRDLWESIKDIKSPTHEESIPDESEMSEPFEDARKNEQQPIESQTKIKERKSRNSSRQTIQDSELAASLARRAARLEQTEKSLAALTSSLKSNNKKPESSDVSLQRSIKSSEPQAAGSDVDSDLGDEPNSVGNGTATSKPRRKKSLKFYTSQIAQKSAKNQNAGRNYGGDEDVPHRERLRDRQERLNREAEKRGRKEAANLGDDLDDDNDDIAETNREREARLDDADGGEDLDDEQQLLQRMLAKKEEKQARREARLQGNASSDIRRGQLADGGVDGDGRREITYAIAKNKGLVPARKKEIKNPRVKKRMRYEDKKKKLRSMKPVYKGGEGRGGYGGEATGIKKNLVRSTKLS